MNNTTSKKENISRSDTENDKTERIKNDISDNPTKEKNTNIVKVSTEYLNPCQ